jgi:chitodextrinase
VVYASCHCDNWQYEDANTWTDPAGYSRVDAMKFIGAYDTASNLEVIPEFQPTPINSFAGAGPWELMFDSKDCMWAGGDLQRPDAPSNTIYGGFERFCQRDTEAPVMSPASASVSGNDVTLTWPAPSDNSGGPYTYEVLKDDPTFGTIVMGTTGVRSFVDDNVVGPTRYFVRAVDATGNRSATTPVVDVAPPPPGADPVITSGATWSYRADGQDLGVAWRQPSYDSSSWPTGTSELGWGDGDEATVLPSAPLTHYFVKHVDIPSPGSYQTFTVRLKRDDGAAVSVNGVEVVRDNLPAGELHATTPASSFVAGAQETTWYEYQIPASLFSAGDNTIAVELHQGAANNADGTFDLELVPRFGNENVPPSTPAPTVASTGFSTADLTWSPSTDDVNVIGYLVKRNGAPVGFTTATSFNDTDLTPETAYSYDVIAFDSSGNASAPGTVGTTTGQNPILVQSGDVWSYRSGAPDASTTWKNPGYDVSSWPSGPSQLGWGDGDEATVVPLGTLAQYYVRHFTVPAADQFPTLRMRVIRDDGVAVYLNGVEVVRNGLPAGPILPTTFANQAVNNAAESQWVEFTVPGSLLVNGDNVIAAEVHQNTNNNNDSSFDLELDRVTPPENVPPSRPDVTVGDRGESTIAFSWTASTDDSSILGYVVQRDGAAVGYTTSTSFTDTGLAPSQAYSYQVTAVDTSGNASTPGSLAASTTVNPWLVNFGQSWKYRNDGVNQGTGWVAPGFDDSAWSAGPSELGYGDGDEATTIGPAVAPTPITAYFRSTFTVADPGTVTALSMDVVRDDGFVVYVNGVEVGRQNMPAGTITYSTRPSSGIALRSDETTPVTLSVPPSALQAGTNSIAVEMHQANSSSNDLSFNLRLKATYGVAPVVTLTTPAEGAALNTPATTIAGLCTASAGTVTVNVDGTASSILTTPCVANEWTVSAPLADGTYTAVASQTDGITGSSPVRTFSVDTAAPVVTVDSPTDGALLGTATPTISGTCSTADGTVTIDVTGAGTAQTTTACTAGTFSTPSSPLGTGAYSVSARQTDTAGNTGTSVPRGFTVDVSAPVTTDDAAATGSAWRNTAATVTLTPTDAGTGVAATYYTVDGSTPTTSSSSGTVVQLTTPGVYTIQYFSVDAFGNTEAVKTAANQIRIDQDVPTAGTTFPGPSLYNATTWAAGCPVAGICGTASDALSGLASVGVTVQRQSDGQYWNGATWQAAPATPAAVGTSSWSLPLAAAVLTSGTSYQVTVQATDAAGNASAPVATTFTYDAAGPTVASTASTNKNGAINATVDTFSVTFNEALDPASVPASATLTLRKSFLSNTTYAISGLTNGNMTTGTGGYLGFSFSTLQVTFGGTLTLSNDNKTVTFTVTGACSGSCSSLSSSASSGAYQFVGATSLRDVAGNAPTTSTFTASSQVLF